MKQNNTIYYLLNKCDTDMQGLYFVYFYKAHCYVFLMFYIYIFFRFMRYLHLRTLFRLTKRWQIQNIFRCNMVFWSPWYIDPEVNFHPWYIDPLIENWPLLYGKLNPHGILTPLISNQEIGRGIKIPWLGGSIYHG